MNKKGIKILSGVAGTTMLLSGCAQDTTANEAYSAPVQDSAIKEANYEVNGYSVKSTAGETIEFKRISNVQGSFEFDQNTLTPADDIFNLFGTAVTGMCAKPAFAFDEETTGIADYYVNVSGTVKKAYSVNLESLAKENQQQKIMVCSCATGAAVANAKVTGIPLSAIIDMADLEEGANTITVTSDDGYGIPMPLSYALDKGAMIVYRINNSDVPEGTQLWIPETVAKYFTRRVMNIELSTEETVPKIIEANDDLRAQINIVNGMDDSVFEVGQQITLEGYADDCGEAIEFIEFSMDDGETWAKFETAGATIDRWVYWHFTWVPEEAGDYKLTARARTTEGRVSPLGSTITFTVTD